MEIMEALKIIESTVLFETTDKIVREAWNLIVARALDNKEVV